MKLVLPISTHSFAKGRPAARPAAGTPLTVGLLHNGKPNGDTILQTAYETLKRKGHAVDLVFRTKHQAGEPMSPEMLDELRQCDLVMVGLAN